MSRGCNEKVIVYIARSKHLQTTVNLLMLNLAIADLLITIICLPPTFMVDFLQSWILGKSLCQFIPFLQLSVASISALTLGAIAVNRWFVVCRPLQAGRHNKSKRITMVVTLGIWTISLASMTPILVVQDLAPAFPDIDDLRFFKDCAEHWSSNAKETAFHAYFVMVCFILPFIVLSVTYTKVFQELRNTQIPGYTPRRSHFSARRRIGCTCESVKLEEKESIPKNQFPNLITKRADSLSCPSTTQNITSKFNTEKEIKSRVSRKAYFTQCCVKSEMKVASQKATPRGRMRSLANTFKRSLSGSRKRLCRRCFKEAVLLKARRKSALMQVTLIAVFGICFSPVMVLDLLRRSSTAFSSYSRHDIYQVSTVAHLIMYISSAVNPMIYNFFSAQFRKEFRNTFKCCWRKKQQRSSFSDTRQTRYNYSYSNNNNPNNMATKTTEIEETALNTMTA
ncbi:unnamed protein product [Clavelina lepadiformis]|uniref:G-protein coupled receptors family 1 profile domain-containing protein n=1 Tax=Clavelina lepadiformis TaxID=159417 RepID=A0ABP0G050_CLALP